VDALDAFAHMKEQGIPHRAQAPFAPIHMPRNTGVGVAMGAITFVFGFAMVWHIWWMAAASTAAMLAVVVMRANDEDVDYMVSAEEVARLENRSAIPSELKTQG
jgi:cytochrome o ubiquinol oxidase subunit 1